MFLGKSNNLTKHVIFVFSLLIVKSNLSEGFIAGTLVKTQDGYVPVEQLKKNDFITSYNFKEKALINGKIIKITKKHYTKCINLKINDQEIIAAPDHKFFCPLKKGCWINAQDIEKNDFVLKDIKDLVRIDDIIELDQETDFYCLSIDKSHNYFVSESNVFVHNVAPVAAGLYALGAWAVATFEIEFSLSLFGLATYSYGSYKNNQQAKNIGKKALGTGLFVMAAKAPGKPTENDGYTPPKNWDGKKKKHEDSDQYGYPDKSGNIWIPTGENGHGGAHWDVEKPSGGYDNIMPGGKIRGKKNK